MSTEIPKPRVVAFEVTQRCPLHCRHCRAGAKLDTPEYLSTEQCKKILKSLADFHRCVVIFTGGEPMARPDLEELIAYAKQQGLFCSLATCGWYLNDKTAAEMIQAGVMFVSFSLDGKDAQSHDDFRGMKGAYEVTHKAIVAAKTVGLKFQINTTITKKNLAQIHEIAEQALDLGAVCWNPFILVPVGRGKEIVDLLVESAEYEQLLLDLAVIREKLPIQLRLTCGPQFARIARKHKLENMEKVTGCLAATDFAFISHKGDVQTCGFLEISAGNLVENGYDFEKIWTGSEYLNSLRKEENYKGACGDCGYLQYCRGCRARAQAIYGDYFQQDPICKLAKNPEGK